MSAPVDVVPAPTRVAQATHTPAPGQYSAPEMLPAQCLHMQQVTPVAPANYAPSPVQAAPARVAQRPQRLTCASAGQRTCGAARAMHAGAARAVRGGAACAVHAGAAIAERGGARRAVRAGSPCCPGEGSREFSGAIVPPASMRSTRGLQVAPIQYGASKPRLAQRMCWHSCSHLLRQRGTCLLPLGQRRP